MDYLRSLQASSRRASPREGEQVGKVVKNAPPSIPESRTSPALAAKAIRASSAANRDSSLSAAYVDHPLLRTEATIPRVNKVSAQCQYKPIKTSSEPKHRFWSSLGKKAKGAIEDDIVGQEAQVRGADSKPELEKAIPDQYSGSFQSSEEQKDTKSFVLPKRFETVASSLTYIGGTIGNVLEEGLSVMENHAVNIIQETRKLHARKREKTQFRTQRMHDDDNDAMQKSLMQMQMYPRTEIDSEIQLKASRDVAMAMAAKTKLLLRELKTVKADLAFAKERCAQLEEENKILRGSLDGGHNPEDDDLIRLQLETLLAEKARLAHENSVYARENRFLKEIVEYHQLTMQDVVYLDESSEVVTEVYPSKEIEAKIRSTRT